LAAVFLVLGRDPVAPAARAAVFRLAVLDAVDLADLADVLPAAFLPAFRGALVAIPVLSVAADPANPDRRVLHSAPVLGAQ
jgi:hypothetical protein